MRRSPNTEIGDVLAVLQAGNFELISTYKIGQSDYDLPTYVRGLVNQEQTSDVKAFAVLPASLVPSLFKDQDTENLYAIFIKKI